MVAIALGIPDFEGEAILRIFANSTESEIGCFSAVVTNGATFSQPAAVGTILGIFTVVAMVASFATAAYGDNVPEMRKHYAHSLSILVVFAVFHHIFFTGALSMNWPSVLVAFWSNYAWAAGMIYTPGMQSSINNLMGSDRGNPAAVGAAGAGTAIPNLGGGYDLSKIYKRSEAGLPQWDLTTRNAEHAFSRRALANSTSGYKWYGNAVGRGLPLPGNYSGFAGTLAEENIPASNAFLTGFIWFLILLVGVAGAIIGFKWLLEGLSATKLVKRDRLAYFRNHWLGYTALAVLRVLFIGFFMLMFLTLFQFTYGGSTGAFAIAAIVFVIMFVGMFAVAAYACSYRMRVGNYVSEPDRLNLERRKLLRIIPWYSFHRASKHQQHTEKVYAGSLPFWRVGHIEGELTRSVHEDEDYVKRFGWLASRFRRTRWWFFVGWLVYEFVRACFYGGASGHPMVQVFGLLVVEIIAFTAIVIMRPFEGQRLNALVVYLLGFSKVATVALSAAFDTNFNLPRIATTVIGIVIIVIQGVLTMALLVAIAVGAVSSYFSITRNREEIKPRRWMPIRARYFKHVDTAANDLPPPPPAPVIPEEPGEPYFSVTSVRRIAKIEDEDVAFQADIISDPHASHTSVHAFDRNISRTSTNNVEKVENSPYGAGASRTRRSSRAVSIGSQMSQTNLPFGARVHRASWSSRDFIELGQKDFDRRRTQEQESVVASRSGSVPRVASPLQGRLRASSAASRTGSPITPAASVPAMPLTRPRSRAPSNVGPVSPARITSVGEGVQRGGEETGHR